MIRFTRRQIDRFNDTVQNVLENEDCRKLLEKYLVDVRRKEMAKVVRLWCLAADSLKSTGRLGEEILELIDEVDDVDADELQGDDVDKLHEIKRNCELCLQKKVHRRFIDYIESDHQK